MPVAAFKPYFAVALPGINHSNLHNCSFCVTYQWIGLLWKV